MLYTKAFVLFLSTILIHEVSSQIIQSFIDFMGMGGSMLGREIVDQPKVAGSYDFIIVGAGSAGCVITRRLTENPNWKVLLIESGDSENLLMDIPAIVHLLQQYEVNWGYKSQPSKKYCLGMENHQCNFPRGRVMGGSSVLNYMIYTRGNVKDYNNWADMGNDGWNFANVSKYFKKLESTVLQSVPFERNFRGKRGPVTISDDFYMSPVGETFIKGGMEYGLPNIDYNGRTQIGSAKIQSNLKNGYRQSSNVAYLHPIHNRPNLHVKKRSLVTRLILDEVNQKVLGVEFTSKGRTYVVKARKEVIVSAGAINSPQLLMLSGIGPADHLRNVGIQPKVNLPVGFNFMDHVAPGAVTIASKVPGVSFGDVINQFGQTFPNFILNQKGPMTGPGGCESVVFADTLNPTDINGYPDVELLQLAGTMTSFPTFRKNFGIERNIFDKMFGDLDSDSNYMVFPIILRPKSRGRIMLHSKNPHKYPLIYPNYYSNYTDMQTSIRGIRLLQALLKTNAMKKMGMKMVKRHAPGCENHIFDSDDYWECYTRTFPFTIYHYSGTCKMGKVGDPTAVVDPRLRVHGISNLRVVDASIMPEIIAGHTNGPTMMIAEKAADMIKQDWNFIQ